jgi:hypothetical protein
LALRLYSHRGIFRRVPSAVALHCSGMHYL